MGEKWILFHATEREKIPAIMRDGLKAPAYMMNGRSAVQAIERSTKKQTDYKGGYQALLRITLPADWPLFRDEASTTDQYVKSKKAIPPAYIKLETLRWP